MKKSTIKNGSQRGATNFQTSKFEKKVSCIIGVMLLLFVMNGFGQRAYVCDASNQIRVLDVSTNALLHTISASGTFISGQGTSTDGFTGVGPGAVAISPDGNWVYVANWTSGTVSVINANTYHQDYSFGVGANPIGLCISPDGNSLYISLFPGPGHAKAVDVTPSIHTFGQIWIQTTPNFPCEITISPDGAHVYATGTTANAVYDINSISGAILHTITVGNYPRPICVSPSGDRIYVGNSNDGSVSVISTSTYTVIAAIIPEPGASALYGVCVSHDGNTLYTGDNVTGHVKIINVSATNANLQTTHPVLATLTVGAGPAGINITPDGSKVYVKNNSGTTLSIINTPGNTFASDVTVGNAPTGNGKWIGPAPTSACNPTAYITNATDGTVSVINLTSNTVTNTITGFGGNAIGVCVSANGGNAYITNGANVSTINTGNNTVSSTPVGSYPNGVCVSPDGLTVFAANRVSNTVSVIVGGVVTATLPVGNGPTGICVSADGLHIYVSNYFANTISVITKTAGPTYTVTSVIPVGNGPYGIAIIGNLLYIANYNSSSVGVLNTSTFNITNITGLGSNPNGVAISPDGSTVIVTNRGSANISLISTFNNLVTPGSPYTVGSGPIGVSFSPDGSNAYIVNNSSNSVSVFNISSLSVTATIPVGAGPVSLGNFTGCVPVGGCTLPATPVITGAQMFCGIAHPVYTASSAGLNTYTWTVPSSTTYTGGTSSSITMTIPSNTSNTGPLVISCVAHNACGASTATSYTINAAPPAPGVITTVPANLCNATTATFSIAPVPGATYHWSLPSGITGPINTATITVTIASTFVSGSVNVSTSNSCGTSQGTPIIVTARIPSPPPLFTGTTVITGSNPIGMVCSQVQATSSTIFNITSVFGATSYLWSVTGTGASISNGQNTLNGTVAFASSGFTTGVLSLISQNVCGNSLPRNLTLQVAPTQPPGITGAFSICHSTLPGNDNYSITPIGGANNYTWSITGVGNTVTQGLPTTVVHLATAGGILCVTANSDCANGIQKCNTISINNTCMITDGNTWNKSLEIGDGANNYSHIYPNPANSEFTIDITSDVDKDVIVEIYDVLGNKVIQQKHQIIIGDNTIKTTIEQYKTGMYFVRLIDADNNVLYTERVIKQ